MYSTFNKSKSVVVERFIRTLKNKLNKCNNTKHNTIKMKPKDVKNDNKRVYIDEHNKKSVKI